MHPEPTRPALVPRGEARVDRHAAQRARAAVASLARESEGRGVSGFIAIDTGANGALASFWPGMATPTIRHLPRDRADLVHLLRQWGDPGRWTAVVESVQPRSGRRVDDAGEAQIRMSSSTACAMCRNHERVLTALLALGIPSVEWRPQAWMRRIEGLPRGSGQAGRKARKAAIADWVRRRWPSETIPLYAADAAAMLTLCLDGKGP